MHSSDSPLQPPVPSGRLVTLRPVSPRDARLVEKWLNNPEVMRFWSGVTAAMDEHMAARWVERFLGRDRGLAASIIETSQNPAGFIEISGHPDDVNHGHVAGLDICIGEQDLWNRGLGTDALTTLLRWFFTQTPLVRVFLQPRLVNTRPVHVYEKWGCERRHRPKGRDGERPPLRYSPHGSATGRVAVPV